MNDAIAAFAPQAVAPGGLDDLLALIGLPSRRRAAVRLSTEAEEILKGIGSFVDQLLMRAISAQTRSEFVSIRHEVFGPYAGTVTSLAKLMRIVVPDAVMERVLGDSFCELEAAFRDEGVARFGGPAKDQAMFTVWSLRRTSSLIAKIASGAPVPPALKKDDEKIAGEFASCALWTQFHLDCLLTCIRSDRAVQLDVLPAIIDGLRAAVNAYGLARRGLALRVSETEPLIEPYNWDEEDRELLASSMSDMATETVDD